MPTESSTAWLKEVEDYEARMFDYFSQCSARLKEWYDKGGDQSEGYRAEYNRLSAEYQNYINYIQQLRGTAVKPSDQPLPPSVDVPQPAIVDRLTVMDGNPTPVSQPPYSTATAAACYTQYYQEMITYFDKLLTSLEVSHNGEVSPEAVAPPSTDVNDVGEILDEAEDEAIEDANDFDGDMCCDPQAVMEEYFERFGEIGKWDWASWNNYLSWIARTNPQWYGIFLEYSQSLGIDWDQMYSQWKQSDPLTRQSFDEFADSVDGISIQPPNLRQSVYHGLLFTEAVDDDDDDGLFCRTCQMRFSTDRAFAIHLRGVTHIQRALENLQRRNPENIDKYTEHYSQFQQDSGSIRHYAWLQSQYMEKNKSEFIRPGSMYCELCQVNSSSFASLQAHLSGRRHRENVSLVQSSDGPNLLKEKRPSQAKASARLQTLLDVCTQPLIGLNYIVERQFGDDEECMYYCELCDDRITRQDAINHVCSVPHRVNYMKSQYPDMCGIVVSDQSDIEMRLKRIELFARKIEDFEGRKRVKVKHLSASDALRRIWRPLDESETKEVVLVKETIAKVAKQSNKKPKSSAKTIKKKPPKTGDNQPSTDDLEEGEITEDSSDEEATTENQVTVSSTDGGQTSPAADEQEEKSDEDAGEEHQEVTISAENFLPRSVSNFRPDSECEAYIASLRTTGHLSLTQLKSEADSKEASAQAASDSDTALDDQFSREAEWVLDRIRARQEQEKEQHRQLTAAMSAAAAAAATSNQQPTKPSAFERRLRIQRGLDIVKTSGRAFGDEEVPIPSSVSDDIDGFQFPQPDSAVGSPPVNEAINVEEEEDIDGVALVQEEEAATEGEESDRMQPPLIETQGAGVLGQMDPNRQRLAVSSGAAEIILSALGALRESGQLPSFVNPNILTQPKADQPTTVGLAPKVGLLGDALPPNAAPNLHSKIAKPASTTGPTNLAHQTTDSVPKVEPPQVTSQPAVGLLSSQLHGMHPPSAPPSAMILPTSINHLARTPGLLNSEVPSRSSGVGLLGDPLLQPIPGPKPMPQPTPASKLVGQPTPPFLSSAPQPVPPPKMAPQPVPPPKSTTPAPVRGPAKKTGAPTSPRSSPQIPSKQPRLNTEHPTPPAHPVDENNPSSKVASYIRGDASDTSETMFDGYALYSRRSSERNRPHPPPPVTRSVRSRLNESRPTGRNAPRSSAGGGGGARKMSVIADLLGVNEPPAPPPNAPQPKSSTIPPTSAPTTSSNITYWRQTPERSYLVPVATFSVPNLSTLPRISYYIPKEHTGDVPDVALHAKPGSTAIPPPAPPLTTPPTARSFGRPPGNFDDFFRRLQRT